eukprot:301279-Amphidinium_carterae.1
MTSRRVERQTDVNNESAVKLLARCGEAWKLSSSSSGKRLQTQTKKKLCSLQAMQTCHSSSLGTQDLPLSLLLHLPHASR